MSFAAMIAAGLSAPGAAQVISIRSEMELGGRALNVLPEEVTRLSELGRIPPSNRARQDRALADAERIVRSVDGRYVLAIYLLEIARQRGDEAMRMRALDMLIAAPGIPPEKQAIWLGQRAAIAQRAGDAALAARLFERALALQPADPQAMVNLAQAWMAAGRSEEAAALMRRAIDAAPAAGFAIPESWLRQRLSIAFNSGSAAETRLAALALVEARPTPANWRDALSTYRQRVARSAPDEIAVLRLMRETGALRRGEEFLRLSQLLLRAGDPGQARAVLDDGMAKGLLARDRTPVPEILREIHRAAADPDAVSEPTNSEDMARFRAAYRGVVAGG